MGGLGKTGKQDTRKSGYQEVVKCVERGQRRGFRGKRLKIFENIRKLYENIRKLIRNIRKF